MPFSSSELEWRVGRTITGNDGSNKGYMFPYVTSRGIQDRLDSVFGIAGWKDEYKEVKDGFVCRLSCFMSPEIGMTFKEDGASFTQVEGIKGAISGSFKRAAVKWGIGRYLYELPQVFVELDNKKRFKGKIILPDWALPEAERTGNNEIKVEYPNGGGYGNGNYNYRSGSSGDTRSDTDVEMSYEDACEVIVTNDKYNAGKKMKDVNPKSLSYLANRAATPQERSAAKIILAHNG